MLYTCNSCGASMVYDPDRKSLYCPQCGSLSNQMSGSGVSMKMECPNCGAAFENADRRLVYQCPYCSSWMSVDANLAAEDAPVRITPFTFGRKKARESILDAFDRIPFLPDNFLRDQEGSDIDAVYAPFWLYTMEGKGDYEYTGEKQHTHHHGSTVITDHDVYELTRSVRYRFDEVTVDAMDALDDETIDAALPYDRSLAKPMDPVYLAGTESWLPDKGKDAEEYTGRAYRWAMDSVDAKEQELTSGYMGLKNIKRERTLSPDPDETKIVLLPVYRYEYRGFGTHRIYMNGTSGRMAGNAPCDKGKVIFHYLFEAVCTVVSAAAVAGILGVLL